MKNLSWQFQAKVINVLKITERWKICKKFEDDTLNIMLEPLNVGVTLFWTEKQTGCWNSCAAHVGCFRYLWSAVVIIRLEVRHFDLQRVWRRSMATEFNRTGVIFKLCIICQTETGEELVEKPISHKKLFEAIKKRSRYGDVKFIDVWSYLKGFKFEELEERASWHRTCYQEATHSGMIKRAKERYERELSGPNEARRKSCDLSLEAKQPLTRSKPSPHNRDVCFVCDGEGLSVHCLQEVLWMLLWRKKEMKSYMSDSRLQLTAVYYHITDTTHIAKVPFKRLLSHTKARKQGTQVLSKTWVIGSLVNKGKCFFYLNTTRQLTIQIKKAGWFDYKFHFRFKLAWIRNDQWDKLCLLLFFLYFCHLHIINAIYVFCLYLQQP